MSPSRAFTAFRLARLAKIPLLPLTIDADDEVLEPVPPLYAVFLMKFLPPDKQLFVLLVLLVVFVALNNSEVDQGVLLDVDENATLFVVEPVVLVVVVATVAAAIIAVLFRLCDLSRAFSFDGSTHDELSTLTNDGLASSIDSARLVIVAVVVS